MSFHVSRTEEYSTNLADQLWSNHNTCTDFVIKVNEQTIPCHRLILLANSPILKSSILSDMKEASSGEVHPDQFPYDVVMCVLEYMYTGSTKFSADQLLDAVTISHYLEMMALHHLCADLAPQTMTPANVVQWLQLATLQNCKQLVTSARQFIGKSFNEVSLEQPFLQFGLAEVKDIINTGKEERANSDDLIRSVFRWITHDKDDRITDMEVLLQLIRLQDCTAAVMREIQKNYSEIIDSNPAYCKHYYHCMVTTTLAMPQSIVVLGDRKEVLLLDEKNQFSEISQLPAKNFKGIATCVTPLGLLVIGGGSGAMCDWFSDKVFLFLPSTRQWRQLQNMLTKKHNHACVYYADVAYNVGGAIGSPFPSRFSEAVEKLRLDAESLETEQWQETAPMPSAPSYPKASVLCGLIYSMGDDLTDLNVFDPQTEVWGSRAKFPIPPGKGYSMEAGKEHLYVAVGQQNLSAVYSPCWDGWKVIANKPALKHVYGAMVMRGHTLVLLGGDSADVEQFDTEQGVWSTLDVKMPQPLTKHQAVVMEI